MVRCGDIGSCDGCDEMDDAPGSGCVVVVFGPGGDDIGMIRSSGSSSTIPSFGLLSSWVEDGASGCCCCCCCCDR